MLPRFKAGALDFMRASTEISEPAIRAGCLARQSERSLAGRCQAAPGAHLMPAIVCAPSSQPAPP